MDSITVLLVDDDLDSRMICATILEHHGFRVLEAELAEEGIRMARTERPQVILMDVTLPGVDGWEATQRLKTDPDTAGIPIIMLTARALETDRSLGARAGCDSYLTKPCSPSLVLQEVQRFVSSARPDPGVPHLQPGD